MRAERTIATRELPILFNALHDAERELVVRYPFYDVELFSWRPASASMRGIDAATFETARNGRLPADARLAADLPSWSDLVGALVSSGAAPYANEKDLSAYLQDEARVATRANNPVVTFLAFDTNLLYERFPSRALDRLLGPAAGAFPYVFSEGVVQELDAAIKDKYGDSDVDTLRRTLAEDKRVMALRGRAFRKGRKARMGLSEIRRLERERRCRIAKADATSSDKEANDRVIAHSYRAFKGDAGDVILLTADSDMQSHAEAAKLKHHVVRLPALEKVPRVDADELTVSRLVHDLAVAFGAVHLKGLDVWVWGDWNGKTPEDREEERVQLSYDPEHSITRELLRDIDVAHAVETAWSSVRGP